MPNFTVRHVATLDQLAHVHAFATEILDLREEHGHSLQRYTEAFAQTPQLLVYAEGDARIRGCILASIDGDHVAVGPTAVAADSRRLGIGSAMMEEVVAQAKALGQNTLILGAVEEAERFYLSCGYEPNLFIQLPEPDGVGALKALNASYEAIWESEGNDWSRLMLKTPNIDKDLQHRYDRGFPNCHTSYVFIKHI